MSGVTKVWPSNRRLAGVYGIFATPKFRPLYVYRDRRTDARKSYVDSLLAGRFPSATPPATEASIPFSESKFANILL
jgi:hypothetical protein